VSESPHSPLSVVSEAKGYSIMMWHTKLRMSLGVPYLAILTRILPKWCALAGIAGAVGRSRDGTRFDDTAT
jgi:hypothetical protein